MLYHWEFLRLGANQAANFYEAGIQLCAPGYKVYAYLPPKNILHFIISGRGTFCVGDQSYEAHAGEGLFSPEQIPVQYLSDDTDPWYYCWVHFDGAQLMDYLRRARISQSSPVFACADPEAAAAVVRRIINMAKNLQPEDEPEIYQLGYSLFSMILRDNRDARPVAPPADLARQQYVNRAIRYMHDHIPDECPVERVAAHLGLNTNYFSTLFHSVAGVAPQTYMKLMKVDTARLMLIHTDKGIKEIAREAGYHSAAALTKAFTTVYGISPRGYRRTQAPGDYIKDDEE